MTAERNRRRLNAALGGVLLVAAVGGLGVLRWYQWSALRNVLIGVSLPVGVSDGDAAAYILLMLVGGLSLAALGVDILLFHGEYTQSDRFDREPS